MNRLVSIKFHFEYFLRLLHSLIDKEENKVWTVEHYIKVLHEAIKYYSNNLTIEKIEIAVFKFFMDLLFNEHFEEACKLVETGKIYKIVTSKRYFIQ